MAAVLTDEKTRSPAPLVADALRSGARVSPFLQLNLSYHLLQTLLTTILSKDSLALDSNAVVMEVINSTVQYVWQQSYHAWRLFFVLRFFAHPRLAAWRFVPSSRLGARRNRSTLSLHAMHDNGDLILPLPPSDTFILVVIAFILCSEVVRRI